MRRISVVGSSGAGKTVMATAIAERLRLPRLELDGVYHQASWTPLPTLEFHDRVATFAEQPGWVIDGNYSSQGVLDIVWRHADTVVWIDPPRRVVVRQVVLRSLRRGITRAELRNGNRERLGNLLSRDPHQNVVLWSITRFEAVRERYSACMHDPAWAHLAFHRSCSRAEQGEFLAGLPDHRAESRAASTD